MTTRNPGRSTDRLIESLVAELKPTPRFTVPARLASGSVIGAIAALALLMAFFGPRHDLGLVVDTAAFWLKFAYSVGTAAVALFVASRVGRPGAPPSVAWLLVVPFLLYLPVGIWELATTRPADWLPMLLGHGWRHCTWVVVGLSVPIYIGLWWAFRKLAPTQLALAGAVAGLSSAAVSAVVYCIHCPTDTAVFALAWYTLAFAVASALGALAGTRLLRW
jgi:hypothetical protein